MTRTHKQSHRSEETTDNPGTPARQNGRGAASAVQSVDRAVSVLEILARHGEAGVTEIAEELDVHKSTAFRLLGVLENRGLVAQAKDRGKYYLGPAYCAWRGRRQCVSTSPRRASRSAGRSPTSWARRSTSPCSTTTRRSTSCRPAAPRP